MIKKIMGIALGFIVIGGVGLTYFGFDSSPDRPSYEKKWLFSAEDLQQLHIDTHFDINIDFIESMDGTNYVEIHGNIDQEVIEILNKSEISNGKLLLLLNVDPLTRINLFSIDFNFPTKQQMTVAFSEEPTIDSIEVKSTSSNIRLNNIKGNELNLVANSGSFDIEGLQADSTHVSTSSGRIEINNAATHLNASSSSGNISIKDLNGPGTVGASSGNITIDQTNVHPIDVNAKSGNVTITQAEEFSGIYDLQANSGKITAPDPKNKTTDVIKVRTRSGNITIK